MANKVGWTSSPSVIAATFKSKHWLLIACSLLLLSLLLLLATTARFSTTRATLVGDSMAPAFKGIHYQVACRRCGFPIECGLQHAPDRGLAFCPNCGYRENPVGPAQLQAADQVQIVPLAEAEPIKRWDPIAFRSPTADRLAIKRVVALPGERPSIVDGNLHVNGQLVSKSLAQLRSLAIEVHDNAYRPPTSVKASAWQPLENNSLAYEVAGQAELRGTIVYRHQRISATETTLRSPTSESGTIYDLDAYNQSLSRKLYPVSDLLLTGEIRLPSAESASLRLTLSDNVSLTLELATNKAEVTWQFGEHWERLPLRSEQATRWHRFTLAVADRRLLISWDDNQQAIEIPKEFSQLDTPEFRLTASRATLRKLQLCRDVYYLHSHGTNQPWDLGRPLADDEYFVLGDNSAASTDSRHWQAGIERADILGKVLPAWE